MVSDCTFPLNYALLETMRVGNRSPYAVQRLATMDWLTSFLQNDFQRLRTLIIHSCYAVQSLVHDEECIRRWDALDAALCRHQSSLKVVSIRMFYMMPTYIRGNGLGYQRQSDPTKLEEILKYLPRSSQMEGVVFTIDDVFP
jgi:hypothetical protein